MLVILAILLVVIVQGGKSGQSPLVEKTQELAGRTAQPDSRLQGPVNFNKEDTGGLGNIQTELFTATHYCRTYTNCPYEGQPMGCAGAGQYKSGDSTILAVGPSRYTEWPCSTRLQVCNTESQMWVHPHSRRQAEDQLYLLPFMWGCITAVRQDSCPGCGHWTVDLSEAGFERVCGSLSQGVCKITVKVQ